MAIKHSVFELVTHIITEGIVCPCEGGGWEPEGDYVTLLEAKSEYPVELLPEEYKSWS